MKILLIDDHPMVLDFYENMLARDFSSDYPQAIDRGGSCEEAYTLIEEAADKMEYYDLAILDHSLPPFREIESGSDIANLLKAHDHPCKIIIITSHVEMLLVYDIIKKVNPHGIAIKNDVNAASFEAIVKAVLKGEIYQSPLVKSYVSDIWKNKIMAEENNRLILTYLSKGYKAKDLEELINLKSSAIERRIYKIRKAFMVTDNTSLLISARKKGFI